MTRVGYMLTRVVAPSVTANATDQMTALVKTTAEPGMELKSVPIPEPGPGEVRIRVESVGIDGGAEALIYDWHHSKHHYADDLPQLFGHEFAGTVDATAPRRRRRRNGRTRGSRTHSRLWQLSNLPVGFVRDLSGSAHHRAPHRTCGCARGVRRRPARSDISDRVGER